MRRNKAITAGRHYVPTFPTRAGPPCLWGAQVIGPCWNTLASPAGTEDVCEVSNASAALGAMIISQFNSHKEFVIYEFLDVVFYISAQGKDLFSIDRSEHVLCHGGEHQGHDGSAEGFE